MNDSAHRFLARRGFFIGCAAASSLPLLVHGGTGSHGSLDSRLAECLRAFGGALHISGSVCNVKLDRSEWGGFYQMLAEKFPAPRIRENNLVELRADGQSMLLRVA